MGKTDINKYVGSPGGDKGQHAAVSAARSTGKTLWHALITVVAVCVITGSIVAVSVISFIMSMSGETVEFNLRNMKLDFTSFIYVNGPNDDPANPVQSQSLDSGRNRVWVDYKDIPKSMINAMIAIEDQRFATHKGVDWKRTFSAVLTLFSPKDNATYGGSTITQQLIKNLSGDNDVSLTRKVKEIFRALNLEKKYSKEEILEAYLNVVNFGSGSGGVQAAANLYFGKDIQDCDIAESACIAAITKNPTSLTPLVHPEANKKRQIIVINEMLAQGLITEAEHKTARAKAEKMVFVGKVDNDLVKNVPVWNWYTEQLFTDVRNDLMETMKISAVRATEMIYYEGLRIYSAEDQAFQTIAQNELTSGESLPKDKNLQFGFMAMDYSGRVLASVGARGDKIQNRGWNNVLDALRQPGSSIKPLAAYAPALDAGKINWSTIINDSPIPDYFGKGKAGPNNYERNFIGDMTVQYAIQQSRNTIAVKTLQMIGVQNSLDFLQQKLHFTHLPDTSRIGLSLAIGGSDVTVKEMTAGFQIFGSDGVYNKPYTYYYVLDHDGNVILDNRGQIGEQAISSQSATVMHRLLNTVISYGTGTKVKIPGWDIYGKTGTTGDYKDLYFAGGSPYAVAGIWMGYKTPKQIKNNDDTHKLVWKSIISQYLKTKEPKEFKYDARVVSNAYCQTSGLLATPACEKTGMGWYDGGKLPGYCSLPHEIAVSSEPPVESVPGGGVAVGGESSGAGSGVTTTPPSSGESSLPSSGLPPEPPSSDLTSSGQQDPDAVEPGSDTPH